MATIVLIGLQDVPFARRAIDSRLLAFAKIMSDKNNHIFISNLYTTISVENHTIDVELSGKIKILETIDISRSSAFVRKLLLPLSIVLEFFRLFKLNKVQKIDILHVSAGHYYQLLIYKLLSKVVKAKMVCQYMEFRTAIERQSLYHRINGKLIDNYGYTLSDGVICISNFLEQHINKLKPELLTIKIPPICDFEYFKAIEQKKKGKYFLFCGFAGYFEVIKMIVDSYNLSDASNNKISLIIITNGSKVEIDRVQSLIGNQDIKILSNMPYDELIGMYKNAICLLIPLRDNLQDKARFPNKVCEYIASESIFLSTSYGEIPYYFKDGVNAVLAEKYDPLSISIKMNWIITNQDKLPSLAAEAYKLGIKYFNTTSYIEPLDDFFNKILNS
jgi:glycosyltransferase involved in cell wall biosynthesis